MIELALRPRIGAKKNVINLPSFFKSFEVSILASTEKMPFIEEKILSLMEEHHCNFKKYRIHIRLSKKDLFSDKKQANSLCYGSQFGAERQLLNKVGTLHFLFQAELRLQISEKKIKQINC